MPCLTKTSLKYFQPSSVSKEIQNLIKIKTREVEAEKSMNFLRYLSK